MTLQMGHMQLYCKIPVALNFVHLEPYGVKAFDIKAIVPDLNFIGKKNLGWDSANSKNRVKQKQ